MKHFLLIVIMIFALPACVRYSSQGKESAGSSTGESGSGDDDASGNGSAGDLSAEEIAEQSELGSNISTEGYGDAEAGALLLESCASCHNSSGSAAKIPLTKDIVDLLDEAVNGPSRNSHKDSEASFKGQNRLDLQAALGMQ